MPYRPLFESHVAEYLGCDLRGNDLADRILDESGRAPLGDGAADIVLSSQVLEHVPQPQDYLAECRRLLRNGGLLILSTHGIWRYHPDPCDFWRWTSAGLRKTVEEAGFTVLRVRGVLGPASIALQLWQDAVLPRIPRLLRRLFVLIMQQLIRLADRLTSSDARDADAGVFLVVARKA